MKTQGKIRITQLLTKGPKGPVRSQGHFRQHNSEAYRGRSARNFKFSYPSALNDNRNLVKSMGCEGQGWQSFTKMKAREEWASDTNIISNVKTDIVKWTQNYTGKKAGEETPRTSEWALRAKEERAVRVEGKLYVITDRSSHSASGSNARKIALTGGRFNTQLTEALKHLLFL